MVKKRIDGDTGEKATVVWLHQALDDVERLTDAVAVYSDDAARKAKVVIWDGVALLTRYPRLAQLLPRGDQRQLPVKFGVSAILIRYRITNDGSGVITRVLHSREDR